MADSALSVAMQTACRLIAYCPTFQQLCEAADVAAALAHTRWPDWDPAGAPDQLPIAVIWTWEGVCEHRRGINGSESGSLMLTVYGPPAPDPANITAEQLQAWIRTVDAIPDEALKLTGTPLPDGSEWQIGLTEIRTILPPGWIDSAECPEEIPPVGIATYQLYFGIR